jgi:cell wall-associated NlpC family hydrolase
VAGRAAGVALAAVALAAAGCASTGSVPRPFPTPGSAQGRPVPPPQAPQAAGPVDEPAVVVPSSPLPAPAPEPTALLTTALAMLGTPYVLGGSTPDGFDCSGFTQWVYARHGLLLPRDTRAQFEYGEKIDPDELQPGDLMFFKTAGRRVSHVAIAIDRDRFVHAPNSRGVVRVESLGQPYWNRRFLGARRIRSDATVDSH